MLATVAAALLAVPAAGAGLLDPVTQLVLPTCGTNTYPFAQFGDGHAYFGFGNNGFESGATGWSLTGGAFVGNGNEPWYKNGSGAHSLVLPQGASATSPGFCINLLDPAVRMFTRGAAGGDLQIQVLFRGLTGNLTGILNLDDQAGTGVWTPSDRVSSALGLPLLTAYAQIRVTAAGGTWQVDDAFVDPWIRGG
ncbi:MAG: hypothetical protein ABUS54_14990 [Actinomycetota bacterium]